MLVVMQEGLMKEEIIANDGHTVCRHIGSVKLKGAASGAVAAVEAVGFIRIFTINIESIFRSNQRLECLDGLAGEIRDG
jgi:hypothetical protein